MTTSVIFLFLLPVFDKVRRYVKLIETTNYVTDIQIKALHYAKVYVRLAKWVPLLFENVKTAIFNGIFN